MKEKTATAELMNKLIISYCFLLLLISLKSKISDFYSLSHLARGRRAFFANVVYSCISVVGP